ncbi:acyl-coenzyme A thioesterase THEM4-like isoform X1 [Crotalus tigris]|uniref:acyl-coenzyme A thioesterase THEM4-like isoform X1 n=1 Tax=Crotalus tigris TaxID=88082 RepID=UPI00192F91B9|nr:acyl-coenzyme A thioesterase THEM4-like isoform X1 [Crotalus tigris]
MQSLLRSINQTVKGMATRVPALAWRKELLVQPPRLLLRRTSTQQPHQSLKDFGLPNSSWSPEMMDQFQKFTKMSEDGSWQRIPSYNSSVDSMPAHRKSVYSPRKQKEACLFVRNVATEGHGFEFAMFYNGAERRMVVLLQPGSYLEGMIGFVHGGAVAAILDHTFVGCGIYAFGIVVTASLSVNFKSPIPLGSVVLVETKVEKVEEKKIFLSGLVRSTDTQTLHTEATALLIHLDAKTSSHPVITSC